MEIIFETKAIKKPTVGNVKQTLNYLAASKISLELLLNFSENFLTSKKSSILICEN